MSSKKSPKMTITSPAPVKLPATAQIPVILSESLALYDGQAVHRATIVFRSDQMGCDPAGQPIECQPNQEPDLGVKLMHAFIQTLEAQPQPPETLIFYNSAVRLLTKGSPVVDALHRLQEKGTEILACSLSLQHLGLADQLDVGEISSMATLTERMLRARQTLWP